MAENVVQNSGFKNDQRVVGSAECIVQRIENNFTFADGRTAQKTTYCLTFKSGNTVRIYPYTGSKDNPNTEEVCKLYAETL